MSITGSVHLLYHLVIRYEFSPTVRDDHGAARLTPLAEAIAGRAGRSARGLAAAYASPRPYRAACSHVTQRRICLLRLGAGRLTTAGCRTCARYRRSEPRSFHPSTESHALLLAMPGCGSLERGLAETGVAGPTGSRSGGSAAQGTVPAPKELPSKSASPMLRPSYEG